MIDINAAMDAIVAVQAAVTISSPVLAVKKAWPYMPPAKVVLPEIPAWTNSWTMPSTRLQLGNRSTFFVVHMQLYVAKAGIEDDVAMRTTAQFLPAVLTAFGSEANRRLGGTVSRHALRGNDPTIGLLDDRGGQTYFGLDLFLDVEMEG